VNLFTKSWVCAPGPEVGIGLQCSGIIQGDCDWIDCRIACCVARTHAAPAATNFLIVTVWPLQAASISCSFRCLDIEGSGLARAPYLARLKNQGRSAVEPGAK
jgi:hypothetical protein